MVLRRWRRLLLYFAIFFFVVIFVLLSHLGELYSSSVHQNDAVIGSGSVAILVLSTFGNHVRRQTIRDTWLRLKPSDRTVRHFFALAVDDLSYEHRRQLLLENSAYRDLLLLSGASDDYRGLTRKVKVALKWLHQQLELHFDFILKVDDDSFVQIPQFLNYLERFKPAERLYLGFFYGRGRPRLGGRWKENNWFLCQHYLPHAHGGGYLITRDLAKFIADNAEILTDYANEDVSVGVWLSPLDIKRVHEPLFDTEYRSRGCNNNYLISHKLSTADMHLRYSNLLRNGRMCDPERALHQSYRYNWSVTPLKCCIRTWDVP